MKTLEIIMEETYTVVLWINNAKGFREQCTEEITCKGGHEAAEHIAMTTHAKERPEIIKVIRQ